MSLPRLARPKLSGYPQSKLKRAEPECSLWALDFDDNRVLTPYQPSGLTELSFSVWLKLQITAVTFPFGFQVDSNGFYLYLRASDGLLGFGINSTNDEVYGLPLNTTDWFHVAGTFSSGVANGKKTYLNGEQILNATRTHTISPPDSFIIGRRQPGNYFTGIMEELVIHHNIIYSASQVKNLSGRVITPKDIAPPEAYWRLEHNVDDDSENGYHGNMIDFPADPWIEMGVR